MSETAEQVRVELGDTADATPTAAFLSAKRSTLRCSPFCLLYLCFVDRARKLRYKPVSRVPSSHERPE